MEMWNIHCTHPLSSLNALLLENRATTKGMVVKKRIIIHPSGRV